MEIVSSDNIVGTGPHNNKLATNSDTVGSTVVNPFREHIYYMLTYVWWFFKFTFKGMERFAHLSITYFKNEERFSEKINLNVLISFCNYEKLHAANYHFLELHLV